MFHGTKVPSVDFSLPETKVQRNKKSVIHLGDGLGQGEERTDGMDGERGTLVSGRPQGKGGMRPGNVTTPVSDSTMCLYYGGSSQHVASLYTVTVMLLLELIPGATRPSTDINNNRKWVGEMTGKGSGYDPLDNSPMLAV